MKALGFASVVLGVVVAIALVVQLRTTQALQKEVAALRVEQANGQRAATNGAKPAAVTPAPAAANPGIDAAELTRLREEIAALRTEVKQIASAQTQLATMVESVAVNLVSASDWKNAGRASPAATMETIYWAALSGELDTLAESLVIPEEDRAKVDEWFAGLPEGTRQQYGSAEKLIALLVAKDAGPLTGMQVLGQNELNDSDVLLHVRFATEEGIDSADYHLRHTDDGWRLVVPADGVEWFARHLRPEN